MPIFEKNRSDDQDNTVIAIGENASTNTAQVTLKKNTKYGLETFTEKSVIVPENVVHIPEYLKNASSIAMNVNGSVTPVTFSWTVPTGETWYMDGLSIFFWDTGVLGVTDFGALSALTNGVDIKLIINSTTYTLINIKTNAVLSNYFMGDSFFVNPSGSGFLSDQDMLVAEKKFLPNIKLNEADTVEIIIRDNLTGLSFFNAIVNKWRII